MAHFYEYLVTHWKESNQYIEEREKKIKDANDKLKSNSLSTVEELELITLIAYNKQRIMELKNGVEETENKILYPSTKGMKFKGL